MFYFETEWFKKYRQKLCFQILLCSKMQKIPIVQYENKRQRKHTYTHSGL